MKIFVKVQANAKKDVVEKVDETHFVVRTKTQPKEGKANIATIQLLAKFFDIPKSCVRLCLGASYREKIFDIEEK